MKSGHKTSEFYVALTGAIVPVVNDAFGLNINPISIASIIGMCASYIISRTVVKKGS
jgi:hypothetical protein